MPPAHHHADASAPGKAPDLQGFPDLTATTISGNQVLRDAVHERLAAADSLHKAAENLDVRNDLATIFALEEELIHLSQEATQILYGACLMQIQEPDSHSSLLDACTFFIREDLYRMPVVIRNAGAQAT